VWSQTKEGFNNYRGGAFWSGWCSYIDFMREVLDFRVIKQFEIDESLTKSCGWVWWHENVLAISDRPIHIKRDAEGRLHCEKGSSIEYRDGWAMYHWHGVSIPKEWVTGKKPIASEAITWANIEQRRAACEIVGWVNILNQLNAKTVDVDDDEIGTLLEVNIPDSGKEKFLKVKCGTGREFALPVPREMETALQANAWTYGFDDVNKFIKPEVRT
jgi:hypothetical protein